MLQTCISKTLCFVQKGPLVWSLFCDILPAVCLYSAYGVGVALEKKNKKKTDKFLESGSSQHTALHGLSPSERNMYKQCPRKPLVENHSQQGCASAVMRRENQFFLQFYTPQLCTSNSAWANVVCVLNTKGFCPVVQILISAQGKRPKNCRLLSAKTHLSQSDCARNDIHILFVVLDWNQPLIVKVFGMGFTCQYPCQLKAENLQLRKGISS